MGSKWITIGVALLVLLTLSLIPLALTLIWRNGIARGWRSARAHPPCCPNCGYNLSGLVHCRCPECGVEYRLDDLWRAFLPEATRTLSSPRTRSRVTSVTRENKTPVAGSPPMGHEKAQGSTWGEVCG